MFWVGLVLMIGILAVSTAAIFIRLALRAAGTQDISFSFVLAASRIILATLVILPAWKPVKNSQLRAGSFYYAGLAGICLALHFATWIPSLSYTSIVASTTLVNTNPMWVALLSQFWLKEKISPLTWGGIGIAMSGGLFIAFSHAGAANAELSNPLLGDFLALLGAWTVSFYFLLGRAAQKRNLCLGTYSVVAYSTAAAILLPLSLLCGGRYTGYPNVVYLYILLLALFPQLVGHTSFNWALRQIAPVWIALAILLEPACASVLGYLIFQELPSFMVLAGASIILAGIAVAAIGAKVASE